MDHFATLELPRSVWIDPEALKERFLQLSSKVHPDKAPDGDERKRAEAAFKELNESFGILRNTRTRILHLLELEGTPRPKHVQNVPAAALEFFGLVAEITRRADEILKQKIAAVSPMMKVQAFEKGLELTDEIQQLQNRIVQKIAALESELKNPDLEKLSSENIRALQNISAAIGFLDRWRGQLQERLAGLAL